MTEAPDERSAASPGLTERERRMLEFERSWWSYAGGRDAAVREQFGLTPADYHRALNALIDRPEALDHDPLLVRRLRRMRATRRDRRSRGIARSD
ncbi:DUF3263 domain-containing protein [Nocardioides sp. KR10-350]|uniref:DUF3263 domain-containing protein n=1 Tax=Nocardioides cheoyonin TaxID=3156615 RepID=UPI0032B4201C